MKIKLSKSKWEKLGKTVKTAQSVGDLAEEIYGSKGITFDYALPQKWVDLAERNGFDVRSNFVWIYPKGSLFGQPGPITAKGVEMVKDSKFENMKASGNKKIKISKRQWEQIGKTAGWITAQDYEDRASLKRELDADAWGDKVKEEYESQKQAIIDRIKKEREADCKRTIDGVQKIRSLFDNDGFTVGDAVLAFKGINTHCAEYILKNEILEVAELVSNGKLSEQDGLQYIKEDIVLDIERYTDRYSEDEEGIEAEAKEELPDLKDLAEEMADGMEEARDPYGYRGLRRSDF